MISLDETAHSQAIVDAKAVPMLIKMLESNSFKISEHALSILSNLTKLGPKFFDQCIKCGILLKLRKFVGPGVFLEHALLMAKILSDFSSNTDSSFSKRTLDQISSLTSKLHIKNGDKKIFDDDAMDEVDEERSDSHLNQELDALFSQSKNRKRKYIKDVSRSEIFETVSSPTNNKITTCVNSPPKAETQSVNETIKDNVDTNPVKTLDSKLLFLTSSEESVNTDGTQNIECSSNDEKDADMDGSVLTFATGVDFEKFCRKNGANDTFNKSAEDSVKPKTDFICDCHGDSESNHSSNESFSDIHIPYMLHEMITEIAENPGGTLIKLISLEQANEKNQKNLKDYFLNCCKRLRLSHHEIKIECLDYIFTAIGDIAEKKNGNLGIETIIDANLCKVLVDFYRNEDNDRIKSETKNNLVKLIDMLPSESVPSEIDDIFPSNDIKAETDDELFQDKEAPPTYTSSDKECDSDEGDEAEKESFSGEPDETDATILRLL